MPLFNVLHFEGSKESPQGKRRCAAALGLSTGPHGSPLPFGRRRQTFATPVRVGVGFVPADAGDRMIESVLWRVVRKPRLRPGTSSAVDELQDVRKDFRRPEVFSGVAPARDTN